MVTDWLEVYASTARALGGDPYAGRHLSGWVRTAGFDDVTCTASVWCFATPEDRAWWGGSWAERVVSSNYAVEAVRRGLSTPERNAAIAEAWREWTDDPAATFTITHTEIVARA